MGERLDLLEASEPLPSHHGLHRYTVATLNEAIATLLGRGFAPRFLLEATASRPQLKKGHLWLTLTDGEATVPAVIWASQLRKLAFVPEDGDGVTVVGKLNFWTARAALSVHILDVRPSLTAVMRRFELVRSRLAPEGLFDPDRKRPLPPWPERIALLTSVPSSALADMLRTVRERWPLTTLVIVPVPVQGAVEARLCEVIERLAAQAEPLGLEALVVARGGGSREDLALFDGEVLARSLAAFPVPVVSGLGHEDDTTIADLVADYRAATPTAALVALLPDQVAERAGLGQLRRHLRQVVGWRLQALRRQLLQQQARLQPLHPRRRLDQERRRLEHQRQLLRALSPRHVLERGFALLRGPKGRVVRSIQAVRPGDTVSVHLMDGSLELLVQRLQPSATDSP
ncbi:MAG: exodeoxyribonuclease VII large subunit [Cyanobacteriota bacterium]|nr:exodeoxyribonuclease VII large subunit [Cyanobacteriota bacterium]